MHLRVACPPARTDGVVELLRGARGVTALVALRGAVLRPPGDLVEADVARESADHLLAELERRGLGGRGGRGGDGGSVTLTAVDTAVGADVERAEAEAPGEGVDAVVWRELVERTEEDSTLSAAFLVFLVVATLIAAVGLLTDSTVLVVGAMVLGPEFSALAGAAVGLVDRDARQARLSLRALAVGFPLAIAATALAVLALRAGGLVPQAYLDGQRPLTSFIASPDAFSVIVALLAGVAGTVSLTASKASTLVGVFISVTTVPAAAEVAAAGVTGQLGKAGGSLVQLVVNLACIVMAAVVTLLVQRAAWAALQRRHGEVDAGATSTRADPRPTSPTSRHPVRAGARRREPEPWERLRDAARQVRAARQPRGSSGP